MDKEDCLMKDSESIIMSGLSSVLSTLEIELGKVSLIERELKNAKRLVKTILEKGVDDSSPDSLEEEPDPAPLINGVLDSAHGATPSLR